MADCFQLALAEKEQELQKLVEDLEVLGKVLGELKSIHQETVKARDYATEKWGEAEMLLAAERQRSKRAAELLRSARWNGDDLNLRIDYSEKRDQWLKDYKGEK